MQTAFSTSFRLLFSFTASKACSWEPAPAAPRDSLPYLLPSIDARLHWRSALRARALVESQAIRPRPALLKRRWGSSQNALDVRQVCPPHLEPIPAGGVGTPPAGPLLCTSGR